MAEEARKVWIVGATVGEYSDRTEYTVGSFESEADAKAYVEYVETACRELTPPDDTDWDARAAWEKAMSAIDPSFSTYCGDPPLYTTWPELVMPAGTSPLDAAAAFVAERKAFVAAYQAKATGGDQ